MGPPNHRYATRVVPYGEAAIAEAAALILAGECVAVPTETVYGLAADATSESAVARIYQAKQRPAFNPLIVHIASRDDAEALAVFGEEARTLADRFWPGPLTLVLPSRPGSAVSGIVTAGLPTIALRISAHPAMRALIVASDRPLAAPSANASGGISPTTAQHVLASLDGRIAMIVDGGPTQAGLESTIVALTADGGRILRPGPVTAAELAMPTGGTTDAIEAPGQLANHYSPSKALILERTERCDGEWLIGFGPVAGDSSLSADGDVGEAAAALFARLHEADASDRPRIAVAPVPLEGVGAAINDRLKRAAAPRERR